MNATIQQDLNREPAPTGDPAETLELVRYWRAINRRRVGLILFVVAVGIVASLYAYSLRPVYRGTATVLLDPIRKKSVTNEEMYDAFMGTPRDYYLTQIEIMKSRDLADRLVRVLNLSKHADYDPRRVKEKGWIGTTLDLLRPATPGAAPKEEDIIDGATSQVMGALSFQPVRNTQIVKISFESHDPVLAERVPNTLAMIYVVSDLEARGDETRRSWSFLAGQADELRKKLADSERELQQYRESQKVVIAKGISVSDAARRLEDATTSLAEARRKRMDAESVYRQVSAAAQGQSSEALEALAVLQANPVLLRLKESLIEAEKRYAEASRRYGPEHPRMVSAQSDLKGAQDAVRRQITTLVQTVTKELEAAKANEASIEQSQSRAKSEAQVFNRAEFSLARLERDVESNRKLYEAFMQRTKEVGVGDMRQAIARVVDVATMPKAPSGPNVQRIVMLAMLGALVFAVAVALLLERMDTKIRTGYELETKLDIKTAGVLPLMKSNADAPLERIVVDDNANTFAEGIRTVRSVVQLSTVDSPLKTVLVTSSVPDEGKTTVASNLALAFAQVKKTVLIEADMRKPKLARLLGLDPNHAGLSDFVSGDKTLEECLHAVEGTTLHALPAGRIPLNPLEMLSSQRFTDAMGALRKMYDVLVIDSPPMQIVSDAMVLSRFATAVLFVVKADSTPYPLARESIIRLHRVKAPLLGAVLNRFDVERAQKYYDDYSGLEAHYYNKYGSTGYTYGVASSAGTPIHVAPLQRLKNFVKRV